MTKKYKLGSKTISQVTERLEGRIAGGLLS